MSLDHERVYEQTNPPIVVADAGQGIVARVWSRFRRNVAAMVGLGVLAVIVLSAIFAPVLARNSYSSPDAFHQFASPSAAHWLGTDHSGRDAFARVLYGGRISFEVCVLVVLIAIVIALPLGLTAGYFGGWWDALISWFNNALFTFPTITLALVISSMFKNKGLLPTSIAIAVTFVPGFVRLMRAQVLAIREETYVEAARSVGVGNFRLLLRHVAPNAVMPLVVQIAASFGYALLAEAGLSFLGFGVQPPTPSWGTMLSDGYLAMPGKTWPVVPAGLALAVTVLAINLVADGLRDALSREDYSAKVVVA